MGQRSGLEEHVADVLRRARKLPIGADRNDLRQLARNLRWLYRNVSLAPDEAEAPDELTNRAGAGQQTSEAA